MRELENYRRDKLTIDLVWANKFGLYIIIPIVLLFILPYYFIWKPRFNIIQYLDNAGPLGLALDFVLVFVVLILGIVLHELIHGITWAIFAKRRFKSIKFGVLWNVLTPYCHCKEPLTVRQYIIGAITPALFLGILPSVYAIVIGNLKLLVFGIFFTIAAAGDFLVFDLIRKEKSSDLVQDHPSEMGCYIYRKISN